MHYMGPEERAESDRIAAAMAYDTEEGDEGELRGDESAAAPETSATSSPKAPAVHSGPRRSSRPGADDGAHVRQTRGNYSARPPDKKKAARRTWQ